MPRTTNIQKHYEALERERDSVKYRLRLAEETEWNWPSTRARCEVWRLEAALERIEEQLFVRLHDECPVTLQTKVAALVS